MTRQSGGKFSSGSNVAESLVWCNLFVIACFSLMLIYRLSSSIDQTFLSVYMKRARANLELHT